jgi:hypothetical protein
LEKLKIEMSAKTDRYNNVYYYTTCNVPVMIDLSKTVIHVYPGVDPKNPNRQIAELVVREYDRDAYQNRRENVAQKIPQEVPFDNSVNDRGSRKVTRTRLEDE